MFDTRSVSTLALGFLFATSGCASGSEDGDGSGGQAGDENVAGPNGTTGSGGDAGTGGDGSGGGNPAVCSAAPCGGELVAHWRYAQPCGETPWTEDACVDGLFRRSRYVLWSEGEVTYSAEGTATISKRIVAGWEFDIPLPCAPLGATCANAVQGDGVVCTQEGNNCLCNTIAEGPLETATEPYTTSGKTLTIGPAGEEATLDYCVVGKTARFTHPESGETFYLERD